MNPLKYEETSQGDIKQILAAVAKHIPNGKWYNNSIHDPPTPSNNTIFTNVFFLLKYQLIHCKIDKFQDLLCCLKKSISVRVAFSMYAFGNAWHKFCACFILAIQHVNNTTLTCPWKACKCVFEIQKNSWRPKVIANNRHALARLWHA